VVKSGSEKIKIGSKLVLLLIIFSYWLEGFI